MCEYGVISISWTAGFSVETCPPARNLIDVREYDKLVA